MSDTSNPELDPRLEDWLTEARREDTGALAEPDVDALLADVEGRLEKADKSPRFWLKSRPTWLRRLTALSAVALVVVAGGLVGLRADVAEVPVVWLGVAVSSLGFLLGAAAWMAMRPLHQPPPARWVSASLVGLTLLSTFSLALFAPDGRGGLEPATLLHEMISPCLFYGLFMGLPVFLVLRLLDRGPGISALIGACAAGLAGNLVLQLHCPRGDAEHLMGAHFTVALLFVVGLFLVHKAVDRLRR